MQEGAELQFLHNLKILKDSIMSMCLGDGVEAIVAAIKRNELSAYPFIEKLISDYLDPFTVASNYLNPKLNGKIFQDLDVSSDENYFGARKFLINEYILPAKTLVQYGYYNSKQNDFQQAFMRIEKYTATTFWEPLRSTAPQLGNFCLKMLKIPAIPPRLEMEKLYEIRLKEYSDYSYVHVMSLLLKEKKFWFILTNI